MALKRAKKCMAGCASFRHLRIAWETAMSEVEILNSLREKLVSERRRVARLGIEKQTERPESWAASLRILQELIEAVDRAATDETSLESGIPSPSIRSF
jgi:hypothetical protein